MTRLGDWFRHRLGGDELVEVDPDATVLVGYVALWSADIIVRQLSDQGIRATYAEERGPFYEIGFAKARIYCAGRDADTARRVIEDVLRGDPTTEAGHSPP